MTATFPVTLDVFTSIPASTTQDVAIGGRTHRVFHVDEGDAIEALEAKVGTGASTPAANTVLRGTGTGTTSFGQVQAGDVAAGAVMKQLAKVTLGVDTATVSFSSISSAYSSLMIQCQARSSTAAGIDNLLLRVGNGSADAGANYDYQYILGNASTATLGEAFAQTSIITANIPANTATASRAGVCTIHIPNYAGTAWTKEIITLVANHFATTASGGYVGQFAAQWRSTSAIDTVTFLCAGNFKAGSVFVLWGLP